MVKTKQRTVNRGALRCGLIGIALCLVSFGLSIPIQYIAMWSGPLWLASAGQTIVYALPMAGGMLVAWWIFAVICGRTQAGQVADGHQ